MGYTKEQCAQDNRLGSIQFILVLATFLALYVLFIVSTKATKLIKTIFQGKRACASAFGFQEIWLY